MASVTTRRMESLEEFKVGNLYRGGKSSNQYRCVAVVDGYPVLYCLDSSTPFALVMTHIQQYSFYEERTLRELFIAFREDGTVAAVFDRKEYGEEFISKEDGEEYIPTRDRNCELVRMVEALD